MMALTNEQQIAFQEVRKVMCDRIKTYCFTDEMLRDKSMFQLLNLLMLLSGSRNYLGQFSHTAYTLEEIFGADAFWDKPVVEPKTEEEEKNQAKSEEQKPVVH